MELRSRGKTKWQGMGFRSGQRWKVPGPQARRSQRTHQQGRETLAPVKVIPLAIASRTDLFSFRAIYRFEASLFASRFGSTRRMAELARRRRNWRVSDRRRF